jgi:hypothetical protein
MAASWHAGNLCRLDRYVFLLKSGI